MRPPATLRAAWSEIDLDALRRNAERIARIAAGRPIRAVLKADAYGHGAVEIARALERCGVDRFAVALVEEGVELRRAGISGDILVMGTCRDGQCPNVMTHGLAPTVSSPRQLEMWAAVTSDAERPQPIHLKVNTGMNRLGMSLEELSAALDRVRASSGLELVGLMSHLADADLPESERTGQQITEFARAVELLTEDERPSVEVHLANSAGLLHHESTIDNGVRPGLALLGYDPAERMTNLEPVMSVRARVVQVHRLGVGERVGYGGRWRAERPSRVGTVPLGYADGYPRALGGRGEVLAAGRRVPIIGAVSMDMLAVDLTDVATDEGDEIVLLGRQDRETISATDLASRAGTLVYDVLCGLGLRLPKLSVSAGRTVAVLCRFERRTPA